jgi:hypothetical protein
VNRGILTVVDVSVCSVKEICGGLALSDAGVVLKLKYRVCCGIMSSA